VHTPLRDSNNLVNKESEEGKKLGPPKAAVICLNGDKAGCIKVVDHIQNLYRRRKLTEWKFLSEDSMVPVFVVFTPYRNIYSALSILNSEINEPISNMQLDMKSIMSEMKSDISEIKSLIYVMMTALAGIGLMRVLGKRG
jgi:hypothetical protein